MSNDKVIYLQDHVRVIESETMEQDMAAARLERIRISLQRINNLMAELNDMRKAADHEQEK